MIITEISPQKKRGRYNLFVDDIFYSGLGAEAIIKNGLKVGMDICKDRLDEIVLESEERAAFEKVLSIISRQMQTRFEIGRKLSKYGFGELAIEGAIKKAENYGYLDDKCYAKMFVDAKKTKSKLEVKSLLFKKGISNSIIGEEIQKIDEEMEKENAAKLAEKYMKNKEADRKSLSGLFGFLTRKGYSSSSVRFAMQKYKFDEFED